jgi:hypothetical protein
MDENQFWLSVLRIAGATLAAVALTIAGCVGHSNYRVAALIESGVDPTAAACAVRGIDSIGEGMLCAAVANRGEATK